MNSIRNKHEGKRFWICGSGGSLLDVDEDKIPKEDIIMCCNSSTYHFKNRIDYGVFTDGTANYSDWYIKLKDIKDTIIILLNREISQIKEETILLEKEFDRWDMSKGAEKIIGGYDVIHCATHIAHIMGASEIILCGVDLKHYNSKDKYPYPQDVIDSTPDELKQFIKETSAGNADLFDGHLGMSLGGWDKIKANNDLNIRSIGVDGNLKHYPLIAFNDLINEL